MGIVVATHYFYWKTLMLCLRNGNTRNVYVLNNVNLNIGDSIKDLDVIVTSDLSWHLNVAEVVKKANN